MTARLTGPVDTRRRLIVCPLLTPVTDREDLDRDALAALVERLRPGVDGYMVGGTTGEATLIPPELIAQALGIVAAAPDRLVVAGVITPSTRDVLARIDTAAAHGAHYAAVSSPYYFTDLSDADLIRHFTTIADRSALPVLLYNIPSRTGCPVGAAVVAELHRHPNVHGVKDSSGDWGLFTELLTLRHESFAVLQGATERVAVESLRAGADGLVCGLENLSPGLLGALRDRYRAADDDRVLTGLREAVDHLAGVVEQGHPIAALKHALALRGIGTGRAVRPLPDLDPAARAAVGRLVAASDAARRRVLPP